MVNVVPSPGAVSRSTVARWASAMDLTVSRPSPWPPLAWRVLKKGSKTR